MFGAIHSFFSSRSWLAWILIVLAVRMAVGGLFPPLKSMRASMLDILLKRAVRSSDGEIRKLAWECLYHAAIAFDEQRGFLEKRLKEEGKSSPHLDLEIMQFSKRVQKEIGRAHV